MPAALPSQFLSQPFLLSDAIIDVTVIDEGWMEGHEERTGAYGMLPSNCVEKQ